MSHERIVDASIFAQAHLDESLSLERLAGAAGMSAHHFHRLFAQATGETPAKYVECLRLEKAAFRLLLHDDPILAVALDCGYANHETLTRAFRRRLGVSPGDYRKRQRLTFETRRSAENSGNTNNAYQLSSTRVTRLQPLPIAYIRAVGPYGDVDPDLWRRLTEWALARGLPKEHLLIGIGHDAPGIAPSDKLRFDACITIQPNVEGDGEIRVRTLPPVLCCVTTHIGAYATLPNAYPQIFERAASQPGYEIIGLPAIEIYRDSNVDLLRAVSTTDVYLPVKRSNGG